MVAATQLQLIGELVVKDLASATFDRATDAARKFAEAQDQGSDTAIKSTRSQETAARSFERLLNSIDPARAAYQDFANKVAQIQRAQELGVATDEDAAQALEKLEEKLKSIVSGYDSVGQAARRAAEEQAKLIETARAAQQAENAQSGFNSILGVRSFQPGAAASSAAVFEAAAKAAQDEERAIAVLNAETSAFFAKYDPAAAATQRFADAIAQANRLLQAGKISTQEYDAALAAEQAVLNSTAASARRFGAATGSAFGSAGVMIQQAGYQVGDFAVQVASGQGVLRPFIQQGTQLISMFGPWGAVVGAAGAVVGALATSLSDTKDAANDASKAVDVYADALRAADEIARKLKGDNQETIDALQAERRYRLGVADAAIAEAQAKLKAAEADVQNSLGIDRATLNGDGVDTTGAFIQEAAQKRLDEISKVEREVINKQRQIAAELAYGGQNMDPFAAQGSDHSGDYYKPKAVNDNAHSSRVQQIKDIADQKSALSDLLSKMQQEDDLLKSSGAQREALTKQREIETAISQAQSAAERDYQAGLRDTEILTVQELQHVKDLAAAHYDVAAAQAKTTEAAKAQAKVEADLAKQNEQAAHELTGFMDQSVDRIGSAVTQFTVQTGHAFSDMKGIALGVLSEIEQELIKLSVINPLKNALDGGSAPTTSGLLGFLFGGGGLNSSGYRLTGAGPGASSNTSTGGWLGSLLGFAAGGGYIEVGEHGPEKFYPGVSGMIAPNGTSLVRDHQMIAANANARSGDNSGVIVNIIDQRQSGADVQTRHSTGPNGQRQIDVIVADSVKRQIGNGTFDAAMLSNFSVNRASSVRR